MDDIRRMAAATLTLRPKVDYLTLEARVLALANADPEKLAQLCRDAGINVALSVIDDTTEKNKQLVEGMTSLLVQAMHQIERPRTSRARDEVPRVAGRLFQGTPEKPPINGAAECARRRKQIAKGMLNASSGLVSG